MLFRNGRLLSLLRRFRELTRLLCCPSRPQLPDTALESRIIFLFGFSIVSIVLFAPSRVVGLQADEARDVRKILQQASDAAASVSDKSPFAKLQILVKIASAQAAEGDDQNTEKTISAARKVAALMPDDPVSLHDKLKNTLTIATAQDRAGNRRAALATLDEALQATSRMRSEAMKTPLNTLYLGFIESSEVQIAVVLAHMGEIERALNIIKGTTGAVWKHLPPAGFALIAVIQSQAGRESDAKATFKRAEQSATTIGDDSEKIKALLEIAEAGAQAADHPGARATIESARKIALKLDDKGRNYRSSGLSQIAKSEMRLGGAKTALQTASTIPHETIKFEVFLDIAREQARAGDQDGAQLTLQDATKQALSLPYDTIRMDWLTKIVFVQGQIGNHKEVLRMVTAYQLPLEPRPGLREQIAIAHARNGDIDAAIETINRLEERATRFKIGALAELGAAQLRSGNNQAAALTFAQAVERVNALTKRAAFPDDLESFRKIASLQAKAGDSEGALALAFKQESPIARAFLLFGIAEGLTERKKTNTSR